MDDITQQVVQQVKTKLPEVIQRLLRDGYHPANNGALQLECRLVTGNHSATGTAHNDDGMQLVSINVDTSLVSLGSTDSIRRQRSAAQESSSFPAEQEFRSSRNEDSRHISPSLSSSPINEDGPRPSKRQKRNPGSTIHPNQPASVDEGTSQVNIAQPATLDGPVDSTELQEQRAESVTTQSSSLDKFIRGVWESLYSGMKMDPTDVIEQWQAIEACGQPRLLTDTAQEVATRNDTNRFARMSILTRKISQTSRTCRSLEVIVQTHWIQCFDERIKELSRTGAGDKAKKTAIAEACVDLQWTEKELRNKMGIWRGYHEIKNAGGWAALVFAGMGLYRFCKYRISFTTEAFQTLRTLRHRFEVAADTLHPRWRSLLGIIGLPTERRYTGHPHDWVVGAPDQEPIPLPNTYHKWDKNFSYRHLETSEIDEEAWGDYDPRTVSNSSESVTDRCEQCEQIQSDDPRSNHCACFLSLYGSTRGTAIPVQVFRTPNGKNNGLIACCQFPKGAAIGEFVGQITSGINGLDVMVGRTDRAAYQIWQGKAGNHTRFVNHSCQPNTQFEWFVWRGTQRIVLVSRGIAAGEEITVDYSDTYWRNLDKKCLCDKPNCRFRHRVCDDPAALLPSPPDESEA